MDKRDKILVDLEMTRQFKEILTEHEGEASIEQRFLKQEQEAVKKDIKSLAGI